MLKQIFVAALYSWFGAVLVGIFYAACTSGRISLDTLRLPGVIPVALLTSTGIAILMTPLVMWAFRPGEKFFISYGIGLLVFLLVYVVIITPYNTAFGLIGSILLGIVGLLVIGFIPR